MSALVREALVKILGNPVILRAAVVLFCSTFAFFLALFLMRRLRKSISEEAEISSEGSPTMETLPLHVFNTVIHQLKQQKQELQVQSQAEQVRARTSESFCQVVLANLSSGVLMFGTNGLVKSSNPAAKEIMGFASATGMSAEDIFRGAVISSNAQAEETGLLHERSSDAGAKEISDSPVCVSDEVSAARRAGALRRQLEAEYETPAGAKRFLAVTVSPIAAENGSLLGVACVIDDRSELEGIREQKELQRQVSAEMALQVRNSLATISDYSRQLTDCGDPERAREIASGIGNEAARLDRSVGEFLRERCDAQNAAAAAAS
jgi:nitrogen fixation/metabolism regulation signal transduction histidine kinase